MTQTETSHADQGYGLGKHGFGEYGFGGTDGKPSMPPDDISYRQHGEQLDADFESIRERLTTLEQAEQGGLTREDVIALIDERGGTGGITEADARALIAEHEASAPHEEIDSDAIADEVAGRLDLTGLEDLRDRLTVLIDRAEQTLDDVDDTLEDSLGPTEPSGSYHEASWGIHLEVSQPTRFTTATVDANEAGEFTAILARYDGEFYEPVDAQEISVEEGVQEVRLDLDARAPGEYLLRRDGTHPLRRTEWDGWGEYDGIDLKGGSRPGDYAKPNRYWYYWFKLHHRPLRTDVADHIVGPQEPPDNTDMHSTPGWGLHFSADGPFRIGNAKIRANRSGKFVAELHEYEDGNSIGVVNSTEINVPRGSTTLDVDLDLSAGPGEYLLCRDKAADIDVEQDGVSLVRHIDYQGYDADSRDWLTLWGSGHPEHGDTTNWFNFFSVYFHEDG